MNPYLEPGGFLGTGASLLADLALVAYVLLILPGMVIGFVFARRGMHRPAHKWTMITITVFNWFLIIFLMLAAYRFDITSNILGQPGNPRYLLPTIHGLLGLPAQLLATYVVYRMLREDILVARGKRRGESVDQLRRYWFLNAKRLMRITLILWVATSLLGILNYAVRYNRLPDFATRPLAPLVTEEPAVTAEPAVTPAVTEELVSLTITLEVNDDHGGGDNSGHDDGDGDG